MGELELGGLLDTGVRRVDGLTLAEALRQNDIRRDTATEAARKRALCAPGGKRCLLMGSQRNSYDTPDLDREKGCIRDLAHAYSKDGGLAVLFGNIAPRGCIVKTAGVDASILRFSGKAQVYIPRKRPAQAFWTARSGQATWSASSTKARRAALACRK